MGLFDKTEEEKKIETDRKALNKLKNFIANSGILSTEVGDILIDYLNDVKNGNKTNDFYEVDFLVRVFYNLIDDELDYDYIMENQLGKIIEAVHFLLPLGKKTPNYDFIKEMIINNFVSYEGYIYKDLFNMDFYALFEDKTAYLDIMNIISTDFIDDFDVIKDYARRVCKYCTDSRNFYNEIISFLDGLRNNYNIDYYTYTEEALKEARKRIGIYSVDEEQIALCNSNLEKVEEYMEQMKIHKEELEQEKANIKGLIDNGKKEIRKVSKSSINSFKKAIEEEKTILLQKLDDYLLELETSLKEKSDSVFKEILANYQKQVREFRSIFQGYSRAASSELIKIQEATQESVDQLRDYVANDEQLRKILSEANESNLVRERIVKLVEKEEALESSSTVEQSRVVIPGFDKLIVPATPEVIVPETIITRKPIMAFDESIPFNLRMETILKKKEEEEKRGAIYHEKIDQIIRDVIEGDWPYLWGPSGCGKSYLLKQISHLLDIGLVKNGKITEPYTVMGYNDPQGRFRATQTFIALLYGKLLAFDEFDNGNPDTQVLLNEIYSGLLDTLENPSDKHFVTFAEDVPAEINPNFRMISAGNTSGEGENTVFSSRGKIDESVQERMTPIFINYDNRVEERIFGDYKEWYNFFVSFRKACDDYAKKNGLESAPGIGTTRDATSITKYVSHNSKSVDQILDEKFIQIKDSEYRESLARFIAKEYGLDYNSVKDLTTDGYSLDKIEAKTLARKFAYRCKKETR